MTADKNRSCVTGFNLSHTAPGSADDVKHGPINLVGRIIARGMRKWVGLSPVSNMDWVDLLRVPWLMTGLWGLLSADFRVFLGCDYRDENCAVICIKMNNYALKSNKKSTRLFSFEKRLPKLSFKSTNPVSFVNLKIESCNTAHNVAINQSLYLQHRCKRVTLASSIMQDVYCFLGNCL